MKPYDDNAKLIVALTDSERNPMGMTLRRILFKIADVITNIASDFGDTNEKIERLEKRIADLENGSV